MQRNVRPHSPRCRFHTLILSALLKVTPAAVLVLLGVFPQVIGVGFGSVEIALGIGRYPFGRDHRFVSGPRNWDEAFNDSVFGTADSDAFLEAGVRLLVGLGIGDVERIVAVNEDAARSAELFPFS